MATPPASGEFERDVVVIGGGGHVGLPLAIAFADRGARVAIYDVSESAVETVNAGRLPFDEPGAEPLLERAVASGRLHASTDPAVVGTAEHVVVVIGTPVDEHLNPNQTAIPQGARRLRAVPARRPAAGAALHGLPRGDRAGGEDDRGLGRVDRGRVLPRADRRGQGDDRAVRAAADRLRALAAGPGARGQAVLAADRQHRRADAGGGRARQAVHQRLAVHQVRGGQPVLHDGQRPRARLRADPQGLATGLPAGRRHAGRRLRRRAVPVQGHDAARGVQQQQLRARPHRDDDQRGAAALPGAPARAEVRPVVDDRRHPRHGVQGRVGRHQVEPVLQAQADPRVQGRRGALHRPVRHRGPEPAPAGRGHRPVRPADHRHAAPAVPGPGARTSRSPTSGTCSARVSGYDG